LRQLLRTRNVKNAFIFCNRKKDIGVLQRSLERHGFSVGALHGDMVQSARTATLDAFKADRIALMVCSDVAARGIDVSDVSHVFNFDVPIHSEDYVHRIGRTGRAGKTGEAFTLATSDDGKYVDAIEKLIKKPIPRFTVEGFAAEQQATSPVLRHDEGAQPQATRPERSHSAERSRGRDGRRENNRDGYRDNSRGERRHERRDDRPARYDDNIDALPDTNSFGDDLPAFLARGR